LSFGLIKRKEFRSNGTPSVCKDRNYYKQINYTCKILLNYEVEVDCPDFGHVRKTIE